MKLSEMSDEELMKMATPIMDNLMDGATERNWERHTRDFTLGAHASLSDTFTKLGIARVLGVLSLGPNHQSRRNPFSASVEASASATIVF